MDTTELNLNNSSDCDPNNSSGTELFLPVADQQIGKSKVLDYIASGGIATVYKVFHEELEVIRAIKLLKPGYTQETRERFKTEAKISAHLHHPNIVHIYNVGSWQNKLPYIEMEYVDGTSLDEIFTKQTSLPPAFVIAVAYIVCTALEYAQRQDFTVYGQTYHGLVHRDIKPANILISKEGIVKLADFGIALPGSVSLHTQGPYTMGTYAYLSPEQLSGEKLDIRCDIYSMGAVMYEMLTGQKAFPQKSVADLVQNKMRGSFVPIQTLAPEVPHALAITVEKCMSTAPSARYESTTELLGELKDTLHTITSSSPASIVSSFLKNPNQALNPPKSPHRQQTNTKRIQKRKKVIPILGTTLLLMVVGIIIHLRTGIFFEAVNPQQPPVADAGDTAFVKRSAQADSNNLQSQHSSQSTKSDLSQPDERPEISGTMSSVKKGIESYRKSNYKETISTLRNVVFESLPDTLHEKCLLILIDSYLKTDQAQKASDLVNKNEINDGFFYLLKAKIQHHRGNYEQTNTLIQKAQTTPAKYYAIREEALLLWARNHDAMYAKKANLENKKKALRAWKLASRTICSQSESSACKEALERIEHLEK